MGLNSGYKKISTGLFLLFDLIVLILLFGDMKVLYKILPKFSYLIENRLLVLCAIIICNLAYFKLAHLKRILNNLFVENIERDVPSDEKNSIAGALIFYTCNPLAFFRLLVLVTTTVVCVVWSFIFLINKKNEDLVGFSYSGNEIVFSVKGKQTSILRYNVQTPFKKISALGDLENKKIKIKCSGNYTTSFFPHEFTKKLEDDSKYKDLKPLINEFNQRSNLQLKNCEGEYVYFKQDSDPFKGPDHANAQEYKTLKNENFGKTLLMIGNQDEIDRYFKTGDSCLTIISLGDSLEIEGSSNCDDMVLVTRNLTIEGGRSPAPQKYIIKDYKLDKSIFITINESIVTEKSFDTFFKNKSVSDSSRLIYDYYNNIVNHINFEYPAATFFTDNRGEIQVVVEGL